MNLNRKHWVELPETSRNRLAAVLSIIPGAGHAYKGYWALGLLLFFFGAPLAIWVGVIVAISTFGIGLLIPLGYWIIVAAHAHEVEDKHKS